jgi:hypothetical protein
MAAIKFLCPKVSSTCSVPAAPNATTPDDINNDTSISGSSRNDQQLPEQRLDHFLRRERLWEDSSCRRNACTDMGFYLNGSQADRGSKDITTLYMSAKKMPARYFSSDKLQNGLNI